MNFARLISPAVLLCCVFVGVGLAFWMWGFGRVCVGCWGSWGGGCQVRLAVLEGWMRGWMDE